MRTREGEVEPFVNLSEITEIELLTLKRMRDFTAGEHRSIFHGSGFDFMGLRDWQAGDQFSSIDWPQSTLTGFSPLVVREFHQPSTADVVVIADASPSTRCGIDGIPIAVVIARAIATIGMSAVFFQDRFGLIAFDSGFRRMAAVHARVGKQQVLHCLHAYQHRRGLEPEEGKQGGIRGSIAGSMRKTSLIAVVSDFLFDDAREVLSELSQLNNIHDVFLVLVDSAFAFDLPPISAGWIEVFDVETGRSRVLSRAAVAKLARGIRQWQQDVAAMARDMDLDVLRLDLDQTRNDVALIEFVAERRLRRT